jgi:hypothetical protein
MALLYNIIAMFSYGFGFLLLLMALFSVGQNTAGL